MQLSTKTEKIENETNTMRVVQKRLSRKTNRGTINKRRRKKLSMKTDLIWTWNSDNPIGLSEQELENSERH